MQESPLSLNDKTAIIYGPAHSITQGIGSFLVDQGADVGFVGPDAGALSKFAENLSETRQIRPNSGRAAAFIAKNTQVEECNDAISRVAETFGGTDIFIDTHMDSIESQAWQGSPQQIMTETALKFLAGRKRGRMLLLSSCFTLDPKTWKLTPNETSGLEYVLKALKSQIVETQMTVNALRIGITEEFLLRSARGKTLKEGLTQLQKLIPGFQLVEAFDVSSVVGFMVSPISAGINGQMINISRGFE
ncbi:MAG: hypothetical protein KDD22_08110, partial [Bdellovibrionales bacterium]|nr:hypothetical protein [Bdellovibrionales bacterium]